jgi:hypothetical protein
MQDVAEQVGVMMVPNNDPESCTDKNLDFTDDGSAAHVGLLCCDKFPSAYHSDLSVEQEL